MDEAIHLLKEMIENGINDINRDMVQLEDAEKIIERLKISIAKDRKGLKDYKEAFKKLGGKK